MRACIHCGEALDEGVHGSTTLHDYCRQARENLLQAERRAQRPDHHRAESARFMREWRARRRTEKASCE